MPVHIVERRRHYIGNLGELNVQIKDRKQELMMKTNYIVYCNVH